jgi:hypothetical protein
VKYKNIGSGAKSKDGYPMKRTPFPISYWNEVRFPAGGGKGKRNAKQKSGMVSKTFIVKRFPRNEAFFAE